MEEDDLLPFDEPKRLLDELIQRALAYRDSTELGEFLNFARRFSYTAPFNAMLLHMQNRGLRYAMTPRGWEGGFRRRVKPGARAYVILRTMGPVEFVFDLSDTEPIDPTDDRIPDLAMNPFPAKGEPPEDAMSNTVEACRKIGIVIEEQDFGSALAGEARRVISRPYNFFVWLNAKHSPAQKLGTLAHELAHIFCGHLGTTDAGWWPPRPPLKKDAMELEAEAVAFLVTTRLNLDIGSVEYLSGYLRGGAAQLPNYSLEAVLTSAGKIETMVAGKFRPRKR